MTGKHPFDASNLDAIFHLVTSSKPIPAGEFRVELPQIYQRILDKSLAKRRDHRYQNGADFAGDLTLVHEFLDSAATSATPQEKFSKLQSTRFFDGFTDNHLWEIVNAAQWLPVRSGELVIVEGDREPSFYVAIEGNLTVKKGPLAIVKLGPGDCFGEMGLDRDRRRSATIRAETDVIVIKLNNSIIERASVNCQLLFQKKFLYTMIDRLDQATEMIASNIKRDSDLHARS